MRFFHFSRLVGVCTCLLTGPSIAWSQNVSSFTLINADTEQPIVGYAPMSTTATINLSTLPTRNLNIRADIAGVVGSVVFKMGAHTKTEGAAPYAMFGDNSGNYNAWVPAVGSYTISATPYSGSGGTGVSSAAKLLQLVVTDIKVPEVVPPGNTPTLSLTLINADTEQPIIGLAPMSSNATINLATLPTRNLNIRADIAGAVGSVIFKMVGHTQIENSAPYAMFGNNALNYNAWVPAVGSYSIVATPYPGASGAGVAGVAKLLQLVVTDTKIPEVVPPTTPSTVTINPANTGPLVQTGRYFSRDSKPVFIVGAGGPEGFLYETDARKQEIIDLLKSKKINGLYFHALRTFDGDGSDFEHPFKSRTDKTLDPAKLQQWAKYLDQLDQAGIVMWFNLSDDTAKPFGCFDANTNKAQYDSYVTGIVSAFKGYKNIIWVTQEEYNWGPESRGCAYDSNKARQLSAAAAIRAVDKDHAIAVHHQNGQSFAFKGQPNIGVFGQQIGTYKVDMRSGSAKQGYDSGAVYVMAEAHPYHKDLIRNGSETNLRQSLWSLATGGTAGIYVYDMFECGPGAKLCSGPTAVGNPSKPTPKMLDDMAALQRFMELSKFNTLTPLFDAELSSAVKGGTKWIMRNTVAGSYLLYSDGVGISNLGIASVPAGTYNYLWFNPVDGSSSKGSVTHAGGDLFMSRPAHVGNEAAVFISK